MPHQFVSPICHSSAVSIELLQSDLILTVGDFEAFACARFSRALFIAFYVVIFSQCTSVSKSTRAKLVERALWHGERASKIQLKFN